MLDQIDRTVAMDMKEKVIAAVGKIHKLEQKAYEQLVHELRERFRVYDSPASHDNLVTFKRETFVAKECLASTNDHT